jgi:predicted nucleic acid-binding protein
MPIIISDASPLHYLVLIREAEVLPALYGEILIPQAVAEELLRSQTPEAVRAWLLHPPAWLNIVPPRTEGISNPALADLGQGEGEAIALALDRHADLVLMDDREGVEVARRFGLTVIGTLGVLERAAERALIDLPEAVNRLQTTNFRAAPHVIRALLERDAGKLK